MNLHPGRGRARPACPSTGLLRRPSRSKSRAAPACTIAVCPSREIDTPAAGGITVLTAASARSVRSTLATAAWNVGLLTVFRRRVEDGHQAVARQSLEVLVDQLPGLDGLGAGGCPPGARQRRLDARSEEPEHDRDQQPRRQDDPEVGQRCNGRDGRSDRPYRRQGGPDGCALWRLLRVEYGRSDRHLLRAGRIAAGSRLSLGLG